MSQKLVTHILGRNKDLTILTAVDTIEADIRLSLNAVDLILLDIFLPGKDGLVYSLELKIRPSTSHIPIIFLTGSEDEKNKAAAFELGALDFIAKPCGTEEIKNFQKKIEETLARGKDN